MKNIFTYINVYARINIVDIINCKICFVYHDDINGSIL